MNGGRVGTGSVKSRPEALQVGHGIQCRPRVCGTLGAPRRGSFRPAWLATQLAQKSSISDAGRRPPTPESGSQSRCRVSPVRSRAFRVRSGDRASEGSRVPCSLRSPETRRLYSSVSHVAIIMRCRKSGVSASPRWASNTRRSSPPFIETNQAPSTNSGPPPGTGPTRP